jgi:heptosyltransferase-3
VVTTAERSWAAARITKDWPREAKPIVGLQIASFPTKGYRDWPIEHFIELCKRICERWPKAHFAIFGGSKELKRIELIKSILGSVATVYAGRLSLRETGALMSQLDLYIGVDTGPTHLMSSFDIPLVSLYHGSARSELIAPLEHPYLYTIDGPSAVSGDSNEASMAKISVDLVFARVCLALKALAN